jgi:hypothetical protein
MIAAQKTIITTAITKLMKASAKLCLEKKKKLLHSIPIKHIDNAQRMAVSILPPLLSVYIIMDKEWIVKLPLLTLDSVGGLTNRYLYHISYTDNQGGQKMINLEKTEKTINVSLADTIPIVRFLKDLLVWNIEEGYLSFSGEKTIPIPSPPPIPEEYSFVFYPGSILIPTTRYFHYLGEIEKNLRVPIVQEGVIKAYSPLQLDAYRFNGEFHGGKPKVEIRLNIELSMDKGKAWAWGLTIRAKAKNELESYYYPLFFYATNIEIKYLEENLNALIRSDGMWCRDLEKESPSSAIAIGNLENILFVSINFLYSLYNGEFKKDTNEYKVLAPITKLLHTYGEDFETVLSIVKEVATIL